MSTTWTAARRIVLVTALVATGLAGASVPSQAADTDAPTVTVTDQPGAPGDMLDQVEKQSGRPLGTLDKVVALDTGGVQPTMEQIRAVIAGDEVPGATVLGEMPGDPRLRDTTMADLSDGAYDGSPGVESGTSSLLFSTAVPETRDWCLTMCIQSGKSVWQCMEATWTETFGLAGGNSLADAKAALERANHITLGDLKTVEVLIGDEEPSAVDIQLLLLGKRVDSLETVAVLEGPDTGLTLDDVVEQTGVAARKCQFVIFTFDIPGVGPYIANCTSWDGGKTWSCKFRKWKVKK